MNGWGSNLKDTLPQKRDKLKLKAPTESLRRARKQAESPERREAMAVAHELAYYSSPERILSAHRHVEEVLECVSPPPTHNQSQLSSPKSKKFSSVRRRRLLQQRAHRKANKKPSPTPQNISPERPAMQSIATSPHPRFTNLPMTPPKHPTEELSERLQAWGPSLPFPFSVDMNEYDPEGSQKMIAFEKQRSEEAHKRYLEAVERSKRAVDIRRKQREDELQRARQRVFEREANKLKDQQDEITRQLQEEAWRENRLQQAMEREIERVADVRKKRDELRKKESELEEEYERQLEQLRERDRNTELYISRAATRAKLKNSVEQSLHETITLTEDQLMLLQDEARFKEEFHRMEFTKNAEESRSLLNLHGAMELGRTMRLAGVTRADVAMEMGLINPPIPQ